MFLVLHPNATQAVTLIGYNLGGGWWLVQNSWGPDWGMDGRFKVCFSHH